MSSLIKKKINSSLKFVYSDNNSISVIFNDNELLMGVAGEFNKNLKELENITRSSIYSRGNSILIKSDIKKNLLEFRTGNTRIISNSGLSVRTGSSSPGSPADGSTITSPFSAQLEGFFANWLMAKITNDQAKVMASPTLILGENNDPNISGAALVDDSLGQATIGRPFSNEGFIKVGETVITNFTKSTDDNGITTCTGTEGTAGITFGAKVDKIDDNGYVTFALSPAISSITSTIDIAGCGIQSTLSVRKLDTGSIRVKDMDTLVLTGVIKDESTVATSKVPLLGDLPILSLIHISEPTRPY